MLHLYTHYERDVTLQLRDLRPPEIRRLFARPIPTPSTTTDGLSFLANVWFHSMNVAPDLVCTLKHTLLKVRSDGSYTIKCCFTLTGTKIVSLVKNNDPDSIKRFAHYQARAIEGKPKIDATSAAVAAVAPLEIKSLLDQAPSPTDQSTLCSNSDASLPINDIKASNENDFTDELTKYMAPASVLPDTGSISDNSRTVIVRNEADSSSDSNDPDNDTEVMQHAPQSKGPRSTTAGLTRSLRRKLRKAQQLKQKASSGSEWISEGQDVLRKGSNVQSNETEEQHQPPVVVVLTTALDTISSFEMEFNADSRVTAMVMYFIT